MSEIPEHLKNVPHDMQKQAETVRSMYFRDLERELLAGYDGAEAVDKEALFRKIVEKAYYEGYIAGSTGKIHEDNSRWNIEGFGHNEGEHND